MPRLVVFGCSYTYGHGLPDCFVEPSHPGLTPSNLAWPKLVANKLDYECLNLSCPGSGNFQILMSVLGTEFQEDDFVIMAFSYFTRFDMYQITDMKGNGKIVKPDTTDYKNLVLDTQYNENYEEQNIWNNWLAIHHCEKFLMSKSIKHCSFLNIPTKAKKDKPEMLDLNNFVKDIGLIVEDKAMDNKHPGLISHRILAGQIFNKIKDYELR